MRERYTSKADSVFFLVRPFLLNDALMLLAKSLDPRANLVAGAQI